MDNTMDKIDTMDMDDVEKVLSAEARRLYGSRDRADRCRAQMLGEIIGNWSRGRLGDCFLRGQARSILSAQAVAPV